MTWASLCEPQPHDRAIARDGAFLWYRGRPDFIDVRLHVGEMAINFFMVLPTAINGARLINSEHLYAEIRRLQLWFTAVGRMSTTPTHQT